MLQFDVFVNAQSVTVRERDGKELRHDVRANVDGEIWVYRILNECPKFAAKTAFERGMRQAHYHAKNSGYSVSFQPVHRAKRKRKSKIHDNQIKMF